MKSTIDFASSTSGLSGRLNPLGLLPATDHLLNELQQRQFLHTFSNIANDIEEARFQQLM
jgi:hypothetical protein